MKKLKTGDFVFQTEDHRDRQGHRLRTITRRRVLSVTDDRIALAGAERMTVCLDHPEEGEWTRCGLVLSRDVCLSFEALAAQGWSTGFSLRGAA
jgi:hypothetical protein